MKPDVITYSTCINAHASSQSIDAGIEADKLIERMTTLYLVGSNTNVKPNSIAYSATIKAWMSSASVAKKQKNEEIIQKAADRSLQILRLMILQFLAGDQDQKPNKVRYKYCVYTC